MNVRLMMMIAFIAVSASVITDFYVSPINSGKSISTLNLPCSINYQADIPTLKLNKTNAELPKELVFSLKTDSTGHICIRYESKSSLNESLSINTIPYVAQIGPASVKNQQTTNITISASPDTINAAKNGVDKVVVYTINANNSTGVFRLPVSFICYSNDIPIVVWSGEPQVNSSDIKMWLGPEHGNCQSEMGKAQIVGYDGGSLEYHDITAIYR